MADWDSIEKDQLHILSEGKQIPTIRVKVIKKESIVKRDIKESGDEDKKGQRVNMVWVQALEDKPPHYKKWAWYRVNPDNLTPI